MYAYAFIMRLAENQNPDEANKMQMDANRKPRWPHAGKRKHAAALEGHASVAGRGKAGWAAGLATWNGPCFSQLLVAPGNSLALNSVQNAVPNINIDINLCGPQNPHGGGFPVTPPHPRFHLKTTPGNCSGQRSESGCWALRSLLPWPWRKGFALAHIVYHMPVTSIEKSKHQAKQIPCKRGYCSVSNIAVLFLSLSLHRFNVLSITIDKARSIDNR